MARLLRTKPRACKTCATVFVPHSCAIGIYCSTKCAGEGHAQAPFERFMAKVMPVTECGCWIWLGATNHAGYGTFYDGEGFIRAHKYAYERFVGAVPEGLILRHRCDIPPCVNPDHLHTGTQRDNIHDSMARGRMKWKHLHP